MGSILSHVGILGNQKADSMADVEITYHHK